MNLRRHDFETAANDVFRVNPRCRCIFRAVVADFLHGLVCVKEAGKEDGVEAALFHARRDIARHRHQLGQTQRAHQAALDRNPQPRQKGSRRGHAWQRQGLHPKGNKGHFLKTFTSCRLYRPPTNSSGLPTPQPTAQGPPAHTHPHTYNFQCDRVCGAARAVIGVPRRVVVCCLHNAAREDLCPWESPVFQRLTRGWEVKPA
jgi:hypothetical protein